MNSWRTVNFVDMYNKEYCWLAAYATNLHTMCPVRVYSSSQDGS